MHQRYLPGLTIRLWLCPQPSGNTGLPHLILRLRNRLPLPRHQNPHLLLHRRDAPGRTLRSTRLRCQNTTPPRPLQRYGLQDERCPPYIRSSFLRRWYLLHPEAYLPYLRLRLQSTAPEVLHLDLHQQRLLLHHSASDRWRCIIRQRELDRPKYWDEHHDRRARDSSFHAGGLRYLSCRLWPRHLPQPPPTQLRHCLPAEHSEVQALHHRSLDRLFWDSDPMLLPCG